MDCSSRLFAVLSFRNHTKENLASEILETGNAYRGGKKPTRGCGHQIGEAEGGNGSKSKNGKKVDASKEKKSDGSTKEKEVTADSRQASMPSGSLQSSVPVQPEPQDILMDSGEVQPE